MNDNFDKKKITNPEDRFYIVYQWMSNIKIKAFRVDPETKNKIEVIRNISHIERDVLAVVYGFSKDNQGVWRGGCTYLANLIGTSRSNVNNILNLLADNNILFKKDIYNGKAKYCEYKYNINYTSATIDTPTSATTAQGGVQPLHTTSATTAHNSNNNKFNSNYNNKKESVCFSSNDNTLNKESEHKQYESLIVKAYNKTAGRFSSEIKQIPNFNSEEKLRELYTAFNNSDYDIRECIETAMKDGLESKDPKFKWSVCFRNMFVYFSGGIETKKESVSEDFEYTPEEIAKGMERFNKEF